MSTMDIKCIYLRMKAFFVHSFTHRTNYYIIKSSEQHFITIAYLKLNPPLILLLMSLANYCSSRYNCYVPSITRYGQDSNPKQKFLKFALISLSNTLSLDKVSEKNEPFDVIKERDAERSGKENPLKKCIY